MIPLRPRRALRPVRPRLPKRAIPWWLGALALAAVTGLVVDGALRRAADAEAAYGATRAVVVARHRLAAGDPIGSGEVELRRWPRSLVPDGALARVPDGRVAVAPIGAGEAVLSARVSRRAGRAPAVLLDRDERALVVPLAVPGLPLSVGDRVDVLAGGGSGGGGPDGDLPVPPAAEVVVRDARVLRPGAETVVVAVPATGAEDLAAALARGPITLALRPPG